MKIPLPTVSILVKEVEVGEEVDIHEVLAPEVEEGEAAEEEERGVRIPEGREITTDSGVSTREEVEIMIITAILHRRMSAKKRIPAIVGRRRPQIPANSSKPLMRSTKIPLLRWILVFEHDVLLCRELLHVLTTEYACVISTLKSSRVTRTFL